MSEVNLSSSQSSPAPVAGDLDLHHDVSIISCTLDRPSQAARPPSSVLTAFKCKWRDTRLFKNRYILLL